MKILLISNMYPSKHDPGYGAFVKNFETSARAEGFKFELAVIKGKSKTSLSKLKEYAKLTARIYYLLLTRKFDAIYVHYLAHSLLPLIPISHLIRDKLILNAHGEDLLPRSKAERLILRINKRTIERSRLIIVPSSYFQKIAKTIFPRSDIFVSPSGGVDLSIFRPKDEAKTATKTVTIGYVSRIDKGKGWDTLLHAVHELQNRIPRLDLKVLAAGSGPETGDFLKKVQNLKLTETVNFIGPVQQRNLPEIYRDLDLFIFPTRLPESLGLVGIEAMACGVTPICSEIGGIKTYMVNGINGFTFEPGNHFELTNCIEKYLKLPEQEKEKIRSEALSTAKNYDSKKISTNLISKIKEALGNEN